MSLSLNDLMRYKDVTAHKMVADLCVKMAEEVYEELAHNNTFFCVNNNRSDFVQQCAPTLRAEARTILGGMLNDPGTSEMEKEKIYEALTLDNQLPKNGTSIVQNGSW